MSDLVSLLSERFSFQGVPTKLEDFDGAKGISFKAGYFEGQAIQELVIYNDGIKVDLRSSTEEAQTILHHSLEWLKEKAGITYREGMISRWAFLSELVVQSNVNLDAIHPAFKHLAEKLTHLVSERKGENFRYRTSGVRFDFPRLNADYPVAGFLLERRVKTLDQEGLFYCQAPLETTEHIQVLIELEEELRSTQ